MKEFLIVIPCYNAARYIKETIDSVKAQTFKDWVCVIVDDGSTDNSQEIILAETQGDERFIVIHNKKNIGVAESRNKGIAAEQTKYVLPLDADDILAENALQVFHNNWNANRNASLLIPNIYRFGDNLAKQEYDRQWYGYESLKTRCTPTNSSCYRWTDWERVGGYRNVSMYEDWEFWIRLLYKNDRVVNIHLPLVYYRVHEDSRWHEAFKYHDREVKIIRRMNPGPYRDEVLVVIPFWAKGAQGNELELAVTGWRKFFKEPYRIVLVGDWHPVAEDGDVYFINCPQVERIPGQYLPHLDHVNKFRKVREHFPGTDGFIYTCDDIYATADITMEDILQPKEPVRGFHFAPFNWKKENVDWYSDKGKTGDLCDREGLPRRNWVCHLPVYYEWDKLFEIYDRYDCDHVSYIVENIYFNMEYPDDPHAVNEGEYHDEVKTAHPGVRPLGTVKWVSNANCGWSIELENMLKQYYGL